MWSLVGAFIPADIILSMTSSSMESFTKSLIVRLELDHVRRELVRPGELARLDLRDDASPLAQQHIRDRAHSYNFV